MLLFVAVSGVFLLGFLIGNWRADKSSAKAGIRTQDLAAYRERSAVLNTFLHDAEELGWANKDFEPLTSEALLQLARKTRNHKALK